MPVGISKEEINTCIVIVVNVKSGVFGGNISAAPHKTLPAVRTVLHVASVQAE